jgi:hypothetical protein
MAKGAGWTSDDWYAEGESQIHFFPTPKSLIWTVGKKIMLEVEAWGGIKGVRHHHFPHDPVDSGMRPRPTTPGSYVISGWGPYRTRSWDFSRIRWGTELRLDETRQHLLYKTDTLSQPWRPVESIIPLATLAYVRRLFSDTWGGNRRYDRNGDGIPDVWVLNDFGPMAINYFRDPNRNRKLDAGEKIMGEMIHTMPDNEGQTDQGKPVEMQFSHGCIHVRPADLGRLVGQGAFKVGELIVVHEPGSIVWEELSR